MTNPKKQAASRIIVAIVSILLIVVFSLMITERVGYSIGLRNCTCSYQIEEICRD